MENDRWPCTRFALIVVETAFSVVHFILLFERITSHL